MSGPDGKPLPLDAQLCFSLYSTTIAINRLYKPMLDSMGVTYTQYLALSSLAGQDGMTIGAIAERLALEPSTITPLVKRLETADLVTRKRSAADERQVHVHLTNKGRALYNGAGCLTDALLANSKLTVPEMIAFNEQVRRLHAALTDRD